MPQRPPPQSGLRILHFGPVYGPHRRLIRVMQANDVNNEHVFVVPFSDRVFYRRQEGKNILGVTGGQVDLERRAQMDRADIVRTVRRTNADLVVFHSDRLTRLGTYGLYGTRTWMHAHRYSSLSIQRGVIRRVAYARISLWFVPTIQASRALEAVGILRERIRVIRPPFAPFQKRNRAAARNELGIPASSKVILVDEPSTEDVEVLTPLLTLMQGQETGYTVLISNPSAAIAETITQLAGPTEGQALVVQPVLPDDTVYKEEGPDLAPELNQSLIPEANLAEPAAAQVGAVLVDETVYKETILGAADAVLAPSWTGGTSIKGVAIQAMQGGVEVITLDNDVTHEAVGDGGTYLADTTPAALHQQLLQFTPNTTKQQLLITQAAEYGVANIADHLQAYGSMSPTRSRDRAPA